MVTQKCSSNQHCFTFIVVKCTLPNSCLKLLKFEKLLTPKEVYSPIKAQSVPLLFEGEMLWGCLRSHPTLKHCLDLKDCHWVWPSCFQGSVISQIQFGGELFSLPIFVSTYDLYQLLKSFCVHLKVESRESFALLFLLLTSNSLNLRKKQANNCSTTSSSALYPDKEIWLHVRIFWDFLLELDICNWTTTQGHSIKKALPI